MLRQAAAPEKAPAFAATTPAALPPLASALPPLAEAASSLPNQKIEPERPFAPQPPPILIGVSQEASLEAAPPLSTIIATPKRAPLLPERDAAAASEAVPLPPPRPLVFPPAANSIPAMGYDKLTAVYDISAHTIYLPDGMRLEAHSCLALAMDHSPRPRQLPSPYAALPELGALFRLALTHLDTSLNWTPFVGPKGR